MKSDLATSIVVAIVGVIGAFFITNYFVGEPEIIEVKSIENASDASSSVAEPNPALFNSKALNPTVEVYVGECSEYNELGECLDDNNAIENKQTSPSGLDVEGE